MKKLFEKYREIIMYLIFGVLTTVVGFGTYANPFVYSLVYNAVYMIPSSVVCVILLALLRPALKRL